jgi:hypothetical protein
VHTCNKIGQDETIETGGTRFWASIAQNPIFGVHGSR